MKTLYLHVGAHKTASSFLQSLLKENRRKLDNEEGLKILFRAEMQDLDFFKKIKQINKEGLPVKPSANDFNSVKHFQENEKILMTNEDFFSSLNPEGFFKSVPIKLGFLGGLFPEHKIKVILYIRNQVEYIESCYTQYIHIGRSIGLDEFVSKVGDVLSWYRVCCEIEEAPAVSGLTVIPYESIKKLGDEKFFNHFLRQFDITSKYKVDSKKIDGRMSNRSYSALAIEIANRVNPLLNEKEKVKLRAFLQKNFSTATHEKKDLLPKDMRDDIRQRFMRDNERVFQEFIPAEFDYSNLGYF